MSTYFLAARGSPKGRAGRRPDSSVAVSPGGPLAGGADAAPVAVPLRPPPRPPPRRSAMLADLQIHRRGSRGSAAPPEIGESGPGEGGGNTYPGVPVAYPGSRPPRRGSGSSAATDAAGGSSTGVSMSGIGVRHAGSSAGDIGGAGDVGGYGNASRSSLRLLPRTSAHVAPETGPSKRPTPLTESPNE